jgi:hypothetical protein
VVGSLYTLLVLDCFTCDHGAYKLRCESQSGFVEHYLLCSGSLLNLCIIITTFLFLSL